MNFKQQVKEAVLQVNDLHTHFFTEAGVVKAVNGVSFELKRGERIAIVGESGSGKSAMAMSLIRLLAYPGKLVSGEVFIGGRDITKLSEAELNGIRGSEVGSIFQDPMSSLDPVMRVSEQMVSPIMRHLRLSRREAHSLAVRWLDKVGIPDAASRIDAYPFEMSGGMRQRVMIAMALACRPKILIADEPTTALDVTVQAQILGLLARLQAEFGMGMLLITHNLGVVAQIAQRVLVMYAGRVVEEAPVRELFGEPLHPYTEGLLGATPRMHQDAEEGARRRLIDILGMVPQPDQLPVGCAFAPRCPKAFARCQVEQPALLPTRDGRKSACFLTQGADPA